MSDSSPYEQLNVTKDASFDEIQEARNRLVTDLGDDRKQIEVIEAAYDAVLMDRLRLRQEGKIKVPDRIRFPEKAVQSVPKVAVPPQSSAPDWIKRFVDTPERADILYPAIINLTLSALVILFPSPDGAALQVALAVSVGTCLYFLNRKERKFGRSLLLTIGGLVIGLTVGAAVSSGLAATLAGIGVAPITVVAVVAMAVLWLVCSFLR